MLGAAATAHTACGQNSIPLGGPYGGTGQSVPPVLGNAPGEDAGSDEGGGAGDAGEVEIDSGLGDGSICPSSANVLALPFQQYPQLLQSGGNVTVSANGYSDPVCKMNAIIVIQTGHGEYVALSASCTHTCCPVGVKDGSELYCPCHGATYDFTGKVTNGPATLPLQSLTVCVDEAGVYVSY
ncbi:MAG: Rieske (2Fe-2S) protein [Polyangiaceae bacterium]|jgi:Rieske Fe-S protein